jgi:membrane protein YqaA with SNARE-associated domain
MACWRQETRARNNMIVKMKAFIESSTIKIIFWFLFFKIFTVMPELFKGLAGYAFIDSSVQLFILYLARSFFPHA